MCTECITEHYGHKFFKYEHSVSLQMNRVSSIQSKLKTQYESLEKQMKTFDNCKEQLEQDNLKLVSIQNKNQIQQIDDQFDRIIAKCEKRRKELKDNLLKIFDSENEQIESEVAFNQSLLYNMAQIQQKLDEKYYELKTTKAFKGNDFIKEINDLDELADKDIVQFRKLRGGEYKILPKLNFEQKLIGDISKYGQFKKEVCNPQICYFGEKHKILIYNIEKNDWQYRQISNNTFDYNYYAAAASLPNGDIIITGGGVSRNAMLISPSQGFQQQALKSMYYPRKEHACVYLDGFVYAIGGYDGTTKQMLSCCEQYSLAADEWKMIDPLQKQKCAFAAATALNKYIYVFGGFDGRERQNTIERYSVKDNQWKVLEVKFKQGFSNAAALSYDDNQILILGGGSNQGFTNSLQVFDTNNQTIKVISMMTEGRDLRNKLITYNNDLYACGGNSNSIEKFSISQQVWTNLKSYDYLVQDNLDSWCSAFTFDSNNSNNVSNLMKNCKQIDIQQNQKHQYQDQVMFENDSFNQDALSEVSDDQFYNISNQVQQNDWF
ncbi:unnamed protein product (macronuclear) [Paramecium tetraurelia]|uniref:Kelch motif family protein n=1 Tax=Paramecium tetraurelia TaxID=5888 RepID=A0CGL9_PARTE|nr:uncharacterized protein GSPATT00007376001 [Paramecium tetraurelia]CAK69936.1 unnamed protein product [Paramecium tetraurelia]|eukprot:XP_001437333.1 hypothetical protein (macronuclear) [Paramecium tetraurelia strain d4-2]